MITLTNVSKQFQTDFWAKPFWALDNVSFHVNSNKIVGFLGANGAGKTTSLKIIMGFIRATQGEVTFSKELGKTRNEILSNIGYVPERPYFYPNLTGLEFISYMGKLNNLKQPQIYTSCEKWSTRFKIDFALDRKVATYSKGMLQRLGFVTALLHNPKLLILDEPVSGLDPIGRKEIKDAIVEINKDGKTVFFSSHIVPDVEEICETVIFLQKGKLLYQGTIDKLIYDNLKTSFTIKYRANENAPFEFAEVEGNSREKFLANLINQGAQVFTVQQNKLSLEEIFYNVRNKERVLSND